MEKKTLVGRQAATKTRLTKIRRAAKALAREGIGYQAALEHLSVQAGYQNGWSELLQAVEVHKPEYDSAPLGGMEGRQQEAPRVARTPNWGRSEAELKRWFERPFVEKAGPHNYSMLLCLDGRVWNEPSLITEWFEEEKPEEVIEFAKERFSFFLANSRWELEPHHHSSYPWKIVLHWKHSADVDFDFTEPLYLGPDKESALRRERLFREIRQQRIRDFEKLFSLSELYSG